MHLRKKLKSFQRVKKKRRLQRLKVIKNGLRRGFIMSKKAKTTYEKIISDPKRKKRIEEEYQTLLISELIQAAIEKDLITVRELAREAGVSPTIIQELKTGKRKDITLRTASKILNTIGYEVSYVPIKK
ncbi:TPA: hypothetical protein DIC20_03050 [Candidatus Dependentiae bacterium]|nr:hypothetical protein [Candidatus Dependentiae bacterium]HCU00653.1 hypothetical protein [Candidatus Dependentiae bacterium]